MAKCIPVLESPKAAAETVGGPSQKPVVEAAPPAHWATFSYTFRSSYEWPSLKPFTEAIIIFGFNSWIRFQEKPIRSKAPGPKFSTMTSEVLIIFSKTSLPSWVFVSSVKERLLPFNIVKYKASAPGISRNWLRVTSPEPGRSTLMTSAPYQANNWVQAGPACTWVKSIIRIPSNGLVMFVSPWVFLICCLI